MPDKNEETDDDTKAHEKLDAIIEEKISDALKPILEKLDAKDEKEKDEDEDEDEEKKKKKKKDEDKKDSISLATSALREKLDGIIPRDKLDAMGFVELSEILGKVKQSIESPANGGPLGKIYSNDDKSAKTDSIFGDPDSYNEVVFL